MNLPLTLDASVFVSASNEGEPAFASCDALLSVIPERGIPLIEPTLMLVETADAIRRARGDKKLAERFSIAIRSLTHLTLVPLEDALTRQAVQAAIDYALRGADSIYVAVAMRHGATLVTLDAEQRTRAPKAVHACTPVEALRLLAR